MSILNENALLEQLSPTHQASNQPTNQPTNQKTLELTFRFRGYHFKCLFCLLSQSQVSKSSSTSPRKLLRLNVSRCHTDRFSLCVFKVCFSILYCSSKKEIKVVSTVTLCQNYDREMKSHPCKPHFLICQLPVSRILQSHLSKCLVSKS